MLLGLKLTLFMPEHRAVQMHDDIPAVDEEGSVVLFGVGQDLLVGGVQGDFGGSIGEFSQAYVT